MPKKVREISFSPNMDARKSYVANALNNMVSARDKRGRVFDLDMEWFGNLVFRSGIIKRKEGGK